MSTASNIQQASQETVAQYVGSLLAINGNNRIELWKYFEGRAKALQATLWDQGKWLLSIQGAILLLPFTGAQLADKARHFSYLIVPFVILIFVFGMALTLYSLNFQKEAGGHIARNFDRANHARDRVSKSAPYRDKVLWWSTLVLGILFPLEIPASIFFLR
jgi:hypothetical protein